MYKDKLFAYWNTLCCTHLWI